LICGPLRVRPGRATAGAFPRPEAGSCRYSSAAWLAFCKISWTRGSATTSSTPSGDCSSTSCGSVDPANGHLRRQRTAAARRGSPLSLLVVARWPLEVRQPTWPSAARGLRRWGPGPTSQPSDPRHTRHRGVRSTTIRNGQYHYSAANPLPPLTAAMPAAGGRRIECVGVEPLGRCGRPWVRPGLVAGHKPGTQRDPLRPQPQGANHSRAVADPARDQHRQRRGQAVSDTRAVSQRVVPEPFYDCRSQLCAAIRWFP
jgi:hypothetical protein